MIQEKSQQQEIENLKKQMEEQKRQAEREMNEMKEKMEKMKSAVAGKSEVQKKTGQSTTYKVSNIWTFDTFESYLSSLIEATPEYYMIIFKRVKNYT